MGKRTPERISASTIQVLIEFPVGSAYFARPISVVVTAMRHAGDRPPWGHKGVFCYLLKNPGNNFTVTTSVESGEPMIAKTFNRRVAGSPPSVAHRRTISLMLLTTVFLGAPSFAVQKLCCWCTSKTGPFIATTVPSLPNACVAACSSSYGALDTSKRPWMVDQSESCGTGPKQQQAPAVTPDAVKEAVKYSIGHQGARVWIGGEGSQMLSGEKLRASLVGVNMDTRPISGAPIEMLEKATKQAVAECVTERPIEADFEWVCRNKGLHPQMASGVSKGDFDNMRSLFSLAQAHDDQLRNRIYCRDNAQVAALARNHCP